MTNIVILSSILMTNWEPTIAGYYDNTKPPSVITFNDGTKATNYMNLFVRKGEVWRNTSLGLSVAGKIEPIGILSAPAGIVFDTNGVKYKP